MKTPVAYIGTSKVVFASSLASQQQDQNFASQISRSAGTTNGVDWVLEGTMHEAYTQHNPNAMFPEPSSTIPNATLTQQRVMEGVLAPALLGSDVDSGRTPFQPDASIPWSEYLKSPTTIGEHPRSSAQEPHVPQNMSTAVSEASPTEQLAPPRSQRRRQESLTLVDCPSTQGISLDVIDIRDITMFPNNKSHLEATQPQPQAASSSVVKDFMQGQAPSSPRQLRKKKRSPSPGLASDDDLADLGLPRER